MNPLFAAYAGPSMNPTLREPELMEIEPYGRRPVRAGDVVLFLPPRAGPAVVHRVVRTGPAGVATRGDNNAREDALLVQPEDIRGRVVAAWRGQKRREISGGAPGELRGRWLHLRRLPGRVISLLLHPVYRALSRLGLIARLLPVPLRPRMVVFRAPGGDRLRLLWGRRVIGRYDDATRQWQIRRPYRLFVDGRIL